MRRPIGFVDRVQGRIEQRVEKEVGDFVLLRADGVYAYQLAVVVDDADQGVTDVVRGADLLDSTARQIHLQRLLGARTPRYLHVPVATNAAGEKLSKQTGARAARPAGSRSANWRARGASSGRTRMAGTSRACRALRSHAGAYFLTGITTVASDASTRPSAPNSSQPGRSPRNSMPREHADHRRSSAWRAKTPSPTPRWRA